MCVCDEIVCLVASLDISLIMWKLRSARNYRTCCVDPAKLIPSGVLRCTAAAAV